MNDEESDFLNNLVIDDDLFETKLTRKKNITKFFSPTIDCAPNIFEILPLDNLNYKLIYDKLNYCIVRNDVNQLICLLDAYKDLESLYNNQHDDSLRTLLEYLIYIIVHTKSHSKDLINVCNLINSICVKFEKFTAYSPLRYLVNSNNEKGTETFCISRVLSLHFSMIKTDEQNTAHLYLVRRVCQTHNICINYEFILKRLLLSLQHGLDIHQRKGSQMLTILWAEVAECTNDETRELAKEISCYFKPRLVSTDLNHESINEKLRIIHFEDLFALNSGELLRHWTLTDDKIDHLFETYLLTPAKRYNESK